MSRQKNSILINEHALNRETLPLTNVYRVYNDALGLTNNFFFTPLTVKHMEKNLDITKPRFSKQIWALRYIEVPLYTCNPNMWQKS